MIRASPGSLEDVRLGTAIARLHAGPPQLRFEILLGHASSVEVLLENLLSRHDEKMLDALGFESVGKERWSRIVGMWAGPLLVMGVYNKLVKMLGPR